LAQAFGPSGFDSGDHNSIAARCPAIRSLG